jgi:cell division protein FtsB
MIKLLILLIPITMIGCGTLGKAVGKPLMQNDFQLMKAEQDAQLVKLQGENSILKLQMEKMEMKLNLQAQAIAGFNNQVQNLSAGRDNNNNSGNTNDSGLMATIFKYWYLFLIAFLGAIGSLFGGVWGIVKFVMNMNERLLNAKEATIKDLDRRNSDKAEKIDKWQNELIDKLVDKK